MLRVNRFDSNGLFRRISSSGLYRVRLCNQGIWQVVTIDDILPVSTSNSLVFSRSKKKQLFAPLIEKALAKMHGSYMTLKSGLFANRLFSELNE